MGKGILEWLEKENPDIFCIQETKLQMEQVPDEIKSPFGYQSFWQCAEKKGYSGVATFCKKSPRSVSCLDVAEFDVEGRAQVLEFDHFTLINSYFPNSQEKGRRIAYKLKYCEVILELCNTLRKKGKNILLSGDYNIAHKPIDLKHPERNEENPGYLPEERLWMDRFIAAGYDDTFRLFTKDPDHYTWWSYRTRARPRNAGWRIDYHCTNQELRSRVVESVIMKNVMGSDHCPVKIILSQSGS